MKIVLIGFTILGLLGVANILAVLFSSRGKPRNGWNINNGRYKIIGISGFHLLLKKIDSNKISYYLWSFWDYKGSPEALLSISPIKNLAPGTVVEFFRDHFNFLRVAVISPSGERLILKS